MQIFRVHRGSSYLGFALYFQNIYKCDHAGQLPESAVSSVDMLSLNVDEIEIFTFSYEKEGKIRKTTVSLTVY